MEKKELLNNFIGLKVSNSDKVKLVQIAKSRQITLTKLIKEAVEKRLDMELC